MNGNRKLKYILCIAFGLISLTAQACGKFHIPIKVLNESGREPTSDKTAHMIIVAPEEYQGWVLAGAALNIGKSQIPLGKYSEFESYPDMAVFGIRGVKELFQESHVLVSYLPKPTKVDGVEMISMCAHFEKVVWSM